METKKSGKQSPKTKWSPAETQTVLNLIPLYGTNYSLYLAHLDRSYSQVKSMYHNLKRSGVIDSNGFVLLNSQKRQKKPDQKQKEQETKELSVQEGKTQLNPEQKQDGQGSVQQLVDDVKRLMDLM